MLTPPCVDKRPYVREFHGDRVEDPYDWLKDKTDPQVIAHLNAENAYAEAVAEPYQPLREAIFSEIKSRTQETDMSVAMRRKNWWYFARTIEGAQYPVHCRVSCEQYPTRPTVEPGVTLPGEQVLLDGNHEAGDGEFFSVGDLDVSTDGTTLAFSTDTSGDERYDIVIRRIDTGEVLDRAVTQVGAGLVWSTDDRHFFYTRVDEAWRPHEIWRHTIGTSMDEDVRVFAEPDERYWVQIGQSPDERWLVIHVGSKLTTEVHLLDLTSPHAEPRCVAPRREGIDYSVEPAGDVLLITHNTHRPDFELSWAPLAATSAEQWQPWLQLEGDVRINGVSAARDFVVISMRRDGLSALCVSPRDPDHAAGYGRPWMIECDEPIYHMGGGDPGDWDSPSFRYTFESLVTPATVAEYEVASRTVTPLKQMPVLGGFEPSHYEQRREWAVAADGTRIPISLVYKKGITPDGTAPGIVYGYGSYEIPIDPRFSIARLSVLDRGVVYAIAHIRGGGEMGRAWYENGKELRKQNTFSDFVACAQALVKSGWMDSQRVAAIGGSAGGLLMGAVANLAPETFRVIHADVPFVDALTTILNPDLPLTVMEWEEWGNPVAQAEVYRYMKQYTPYENVRAVPYPAILATTSLNDTRVYYTEPAKWVQRLRETVTSDQQERPIVLRTEMVAGHGGKSGRYDAWHQYAWEMAFVLGQLGVKA